MENLKNYINIFALNTCCGIEVILLGDDKYEFNLVILKKKGSKIDIEKTEIGLSNIDEVKAVVDSKTPISISIDGKSIITKKLDTQEDDNNASLLHNVLPNTSLKEFYLQKTDSDNNKQYVTVARKNIIKKILDLFKSHSLNVIEVYFGPFAVFSSFPIISNVTDYLVAGKYKVTLNDSLPSELINAEEHETERIKYYVGNDIIDNKALIALSSAFKYIFIESGNTRSDISIVKNNKEQFKYLQYFQKGGWAILILFFVILLINFLLYDDFKKKADIENSKKLSSDLVGKQFKSLKKDLEIKKGFINDKGLLSSSKISFFLDRLADSRPEGIIFTQVNINPQKKVKGSLNNNIEFIQKKILISGSSKQSALFNAWTEAIKKYEWVNDVIILNYSQNSLNKPANFKIEISIK